MSSEPTVSLWWRYQNTAARVDVSALLGEAIARRDELADGELPALAAGSQCTGLRGFGVTIDAERFLRDFCEIIGTPAVSVTVACSPTPYDGKFPVDRLTEQPPLETHVSVELAHGEPVESYGIDLAEALTEMVAGLELRRRPPAPVAAERHTVAGVEVSETDYLEAYPVTHRDTVTDSGAFSPYTHSARGCVGEYTAHLLVNEDTAVPPLLYLYGAEGQEEYHLFPLVQMAPPQ